MSSETSKATVPGMRVALFGHKGWIGQMMVRELEAAGHAVLVPEPADLRADDATGVAAYLDATQPSHVFSAIGRTHGPGFSTIDYLEQPGKLTENLRDNLYAPMVLALACQQRSIHYTCLSTGCIFSSVTGSHDADRVRDHPGYDETAAPDFTGSAYSAVKGITDRLFHLPAMAGHVLNLRIRMPITAEEHPRNFLTKIVAYARAAGVCSIPNSMSVLPTLLPAVVSLMERGRRGTVNLTNPGVISHEEILQMYAELVEPGFTYKLMTIETQDRLLAAKRSNNKLRTDVLQRECPQVPPIREAVRECLVQMASVQRIPLEECSCADTHASTAGANRLSRTFSTSLPGCSR